MLVAILLGQPVLRADCEGRYQPRIGLFQSEHWSRVFMHWPHTAFFAALAAGCIAFYGPAATLRVVIVGAGLSILLEAYDLLFTGLSCRSWDRVANLLGVVTGVTLAGVVGWVNSRAAKRGASVLVQRECNCRKMHFVGRSVRSERYLGLGERGKERPAFRAGRRGARAASSSASHWAQIGFPFPGVCRTP